MKTLLKALENLPSAQRAVIVEVRRGSSIDDAAASLGVSPTTAKARLYYGLRALQRALDECGADSRVLLAGNQSAGRSAQEPQARSRRRADRDRPRRGRHGTSGKHTAPAQRSGVGRHAAVEDEAALEHTYL
jgi:hypothetical protein